MTCSTRTKLISVNIKNDLNLETEVIYANCPSGREVNPEFITRGNAVGLK